MTLLIPQRVQDAQILFLDSGLAVGAIELLLLFRDRSVHMVFLGWRELQITLA